MDSDPLAGSPGKPAGVPLDLQTKFQLLTKEYGKIRTHNSILKKAVVQEKAKNEGLEEDVKQKERVIRTQHEEIDNLTFHNDRLTKRLERVLDEAATQRKKKEAPGWFQSKSEYNRLRELLEVTEEQLASKIRENELAHLQLFDTRKTHASEIDFWRSKVEALTQSLETTQAEVQGLDVRLKEKESSFDELSRDSKVNAKLSAAVRHAGVKLSGVQHQLKQVECLVDCMGRMRSLPSLLKRFCTSYASSLRALGGEAELQSVANQTANHLEKQPRLLEDLVQSLDSLLADHISGSQSSGSAQFAPMTRTLVRQHKQLLPYHLTVMKLELESADPIARDALQACNRGIQSAHAGLVTTLEKFLALASQSAQTGEDDTEKGGKEEGAQSPEERDLPAGIPFIALNDTIAEIGENYAFLKSKLADRFKLKAELSGSDDRDGAELLQNTEALAMAFSQLHALFVETWPNRDNNDDADQPVADTLAIDEAIFAEVGLPVDLIAQAESRGARYMKQLTAQALHDREISSLRVQRDDSNDQIAKLNLELATCRGRLQELVARNAALEAKADARAATAEGRERELKSSLQSVSGGTEASAAELAALKEVHRKAQEEWRARENELQFKLKALSKSSTVMAHPLEETSRPQMSTATTVYDGLDPLSPDGATVDWQEPQTMTPETIAKIVKLESGEAKQEEQLSALHSSPPFLKLQLASANSTIGFLKSSLQLTSTQLSEATTTCEALKKEIREYADAAAKAPPQALDASSPNEEDVEEGEGEEAVADGDEGGHRRSNARGPSKVSMNTFRPSMRRGRDMVLQNKGDTLDYSLAVHQLSGEIVTSLSISAEELDREGALKRHYESKMYGMAKKMGKLDRSAQSLAKRSEALENDLHKKTAENEELSALLETEKKERNTLQSEFETTKRGYEEQLNTFTEHLCELNDKLSKHDDAMTEVTMHKVLCSVCKSCPDLKHKTHQRRAR